MHEDIVKMNERYQQESEVLQRVRNEVAKVIIGQEDLIENLLLALLCNGHVLIEGIPGLAKTLAVTTLAQTLHAGFNRIQFTPDLLPGDLIGTMMYNPKTNEFTPHKGPIFANIILADEINRSPAKVQSALLEAMQEHQVSIGDQTYKLDEPFLVLATQNPIEQEGTYPLPEAQLDRFMFEIAVDYPSEEEEYEILRLTTAPFSAELAHVLDQQRILELQQLVLKVPIAEHVIRYAMSLARLTRVGGEGVPDFVQRYVRWGVGPRAGQYLILGGKARAVLNGRNYVSTDDIRHVAHPVLRHRIITNFNAQADGMTTDKLIDQLILAVPAPPGDPSADPRLPHVLRDAAGQ